MHALLQHEADGKPYLILVPNQADVEAMAAFAPDAETIRESGPVPLVGEVRGGYSQDGLVIHLRLK